MTSTRPLSLRKDAKVTPIADPTLIMAVLPSGGRFTWETSDFATAPREPRRGVFINRPVETRGTERRTTIQTSCTRIEEELENTY